jgi:general stress protein CsbA
MFATLCFCLFLVIFAAISFVSHFHVLLFVVLLIALVVSFVLGYHYRDAIGKDVSSLKVSAWITDLENAAKSDYSELRTVATSVVSDLKKL